jgi:hypothetical protein
MGRVHSHPVLCRAVSEQLPRGTLFVSPCDDTARAAEMLAERFGLPQWRFTNSGTEATMDVVRVARGVTGRSCIVKVEGAITVISMPSSCPPSRPETRRGERPVERREIVVGSAWSRADLTRHTRGARRGVSTRSPRSSRRTSG